MKKSIIILILLLLTLMGIPLVLAQEGEIYSLPLLAVQETSNGSYTGSSADLYLELKEGSGRVFLDTSPLTKIDTQVSTRYAKDIACEYFNLDCDRYDFIYTIRASSNIIGGPSAGAAIAALTSMAVLDISYDESVAITGTINSGGIVGPVGGVQEKVKAAEQNKLSKVLIPFGGLEMPNANTTEPLFNELNPFTTITEKTDFEIEVVEIGDLNELLFHLTGKELRKNGATITVDESYTNIMRQLDEKLCTRSTELEQELFRLDRSGYNLDRDRLDERKESSIKSREQGDYYSSASFCFSANIQLQYEINSFHNLSSSLQEQEILALLHSINLVQTKIQSELITTISDLQTKIVVKERLSEATKILDEINESSDPLYSLAYAHERLYSAISWAQFFVMEGREFSVDKDALEETCYQKIAQGNERYQYATVYLPEQRISYIQEKIQDAQKSLEKGEFELCLVKASQAKAESSSILSSLGLTNSTFKDALNRKMMAVEHLIARQSSQNIFPILGYSYYQYANSLKETEPHSALLYLEYALELSDFEVYFDEEEKFTFTKIGVYLDRYFDLESLKTFLFGIIAGAITMWLVLHTKPHKKKKYTPKSRRK